MSVYDDDFSANETEVDLSQFDEEYASVEASDFDEVPDGKYQARVDAVRLDRSQKGDPMIKWDLVIIAGQHSGRHVFKNSVITPAALPIVKGDLNTLGLGLSKFSDLGNRLEELLDVKLEITKRTRGEYANVYFNRRLVIPSEGKRPPVPDDCPF